MPLQTHQTASTPEKNGSGVNRLSEFIPNKEEEEKIIKGKKSPFQLKLSPTKKNKIVLREFSSSDALLKQRGSDSDGDTEKEQNTKKEQETTRKPSTFRIEGSLIELEKDDNDDNDFDNQEQSDNDQSKSDSQSESKEEEKHNQSQ